MTHEPSQDRLTKILVTVALLLILVAGGLTLQASKSERTRDTAYQQIVAAEAENNYEALLQGVEEFMANQPSMGVDGRRSEVIRLGRQALVRWLASQDDDLGGQTLAQIERYRFLNAEFQK